MVAIFRKAMRERNACACIVEQKKKKNSISKAGVKKNLYTSSSRRMRDSAPGEQKVSATADRAEHDIVA